MNIVLVLLIFITAVFALFVALRPKYTLPVFLISVAVADLGKRLLWLPQDAAPTSVEYQTALFLPDILLFAGAARVAWDLLIARTLTYKYHWLDLPVVLFFVWSLVSIFHPGNSLYVGLVGFKSSQMYLMVYFLVRLHPAPVTDLLQRLKNPLIGVGIVAACFGIYQTVSGLSAYEVRWLTSGQSMLASFSPGDDNNSGNFGPTISMLNILRPFSTFASHEQFGIFLATIIILCFAFSWNASTRILIPGLLCLGLIRTLSRSSWGYAIFATLILLFSIYFLKDRSRKVYAIAVLGWMLFGYFFWNAYTEYAAQKAQSSQELESKLSATTNSAIRRNLPASNDAFSKRAGTLGTFEWRIYTFRSLIADPAWRKILGNGTGSMWYAWRLQQPGTEVPLRNEIQNQGIPVKQKRVLSHIGSVDLVYELGMLGFGIFLWIVCGATWIAIQFVRSNAGDAEKAAVISAFAVVGGLVLVNSTLSTLLIFRPIATLFWFAVGLIASTAETRSARA